MSDLKKRFATAAKDVKQLARRPNNDQLLDLYALYKQATDGDASGERPGMFDLTGRSKFDAWFRRKGTSAEQAMQSYVDLVAKLQKAG
jgi:diazepam-binding inhibitor (GABA receptor modulator, acyl-CoA-binding protein)